MELQLWDRPLPGSLGQVEGFEVSTGGQEGRGWEPQAKEAPECPCHSETLGRRPVLPQADSEPHGGTVLSQLLGTFSSFVFCSLAGIRCSEVQSREGRDLAQSQLTCS